MGLSVVELAETRLAPTLPWYWRDIPVFGERLSLASQAALAEQMATMLKVRLPVLDMLRVLAEGGGAADMGGRLTRVARLVADGASLPDAFAQAGPKVAPVFLALLRAGQQSDALPEQLAELARLLRRQDLLRSQITTALIYPAILIVAALAVVLIVALTLAPALASLFEGQGGAPPASVSVFLAIGGLVTAHWPWLLAGIAALGFAGFVALKAGWGRVVFAVPVFGDLARDAALLTLLRSLALMLKGGRPLVEALRAVADFDPGAPFAQTAVAAAAALEKGGRAHEAITTDRRMPAIVRELFRVGEEANSLVPVLESLAAAQSDLLDQRSQRLLRALAPILTLVIGGAVGALVYSVMDAVFSINDLAL